MVDCCFEANDAGVRDESPSWLEADNATVSGGEADRAALVGADGHVY